MKELLTLILALAVVIVMIFLAAKLTKWYNQKAASRGLFGNSNGISITERLAVSSDKQLIVVKVGEKNLLLGVTPNNISKICELDENDINAIAQSQANSANGFSSFKSIFSKTKLAEEDKNGSDWEEDENSDEKNSF